MIFLIASSMFMLSSGLTLTSIALSSSGSITYGINAQTRLLPLHVDGNKIRDSNGGIVNLRGVNRVWYQVAPNGGFGKNVGLSYDSTVYSQASVDIIYAKMQSLGINCVRMHTAAKFWFDNSNIVTDSGTLTYRQCVSDMLGRAANHGIYVIWETYSYFPSTLADYYGYGKWLENAFPPDGLFAANTHLRTQQDFTNYIVSQITALGSHNNLIIQPWNEPAFFPTKSGNDAQTVEWHNSQQAIINAIRTQETALGQVHHLFLAAFTPCIYPATGAIYNFNWIDQLPIGSLTDSANNIFYDAHCYRGWYYSSGLPGNQQYTYAGCKAVYQSENIEYYAQRYPLFVGEIGPYLNYDGQGYETQWFDNSLKIFNEWGIGYTAMAWWSVGPDPMINEDVPEEVVNGGTLSNYGNILAKYLKE